MSHYTARHASKASSNLGEDLDRARGCTSAYAGRHRKPEPTPAEIAARAARLDSLPLAGHTA